MVVFSDYFTFPETPTHQALVLRASSNYHLDQFAEFEVAPEADADGSEEEALPPMAAFEVDNSHD